MQTRQLLMSCLLAMSAFSASAQLHLTLRYSITGEAWEVWVKPVGVNPSPVTITGSGQVTLVAPHGFVLNNLTSFGGLWVQNSRVNAPLENPNRDYLSFGMVTDNPQIVFQANTETLLFSFAKSGICPDTMYLINNATDPFAQFPNSVNSNAGNELSVIDFGVVPPIIYGYGGNYDPAAWNCGATPPPPPTPQSELFLKLQLLPNGNEWGVFVKPGDLSPSESTMTGAGRVTVVAPAGFQPGALTSHHGAWAQNMTVNTPAEQPDKDFLTFSLLGDVPQIAYHEGEETLLFSFKKTGACPDSLYLIGNDDPYAGAFLPGSSNDPRNRLDVTDTGVFPLSYYSYKDRYGLAAWSCHDCDGDGFPNAIEDTNGDGSWTPDTDASALCNPCSPNRIESAMLEMIPGTESINPADPADSAYLRVNIVGIDLNYVVLLWDGIHWDAIDNYVSGTPIAVRPAISTTYSSALVDLLGCNPGWMIEGTATVTVEGFAPPVFLSQPADLVACAGNDEAGLGAIADIESGSLQMTWEFSSDEGENWQAAAGQPGNFIEGPGGNLYIAEVHGMNGYLFRARAIADGFEPVLSEIARLTVEGQVAVTQQPESKTVCYGESLSFSITAVNEASGDLTFQWQTSLDNGASWNNLQEQAPYSGVFSQSLSISAAADLNGGQFRCLAKAGNCEPKASSPAQLAVEGPLNFTSHPANVSSCSGDGVVFSGGVSNAGAGTVAYQWQSSSNGLQWNNLAGANSPSLNLANVNGMNGRRFRLTAKTAACDFIAGNAAQLSVEGPLSVSEQPENVTTCGTAAANFSAIVSNSGAGTLTYRWQKSCDNGANWSDLIESGTYQGVQTPQLSVLNPTGQSGCYFRLVAKTQHCAGVTTSAAKLETGDGFLFFFDHPASVVACPDEQVSFSFDFAFVGESLLYFQWQGSYDGGLNWENLEGNYHYVNTSGICYDNLTDALSIVVLESLIGWQYRVALLADGCELGHSEAATLTVTAYPGCTQNLVAPGTPPFIPASPLRMRNVEYPDAASGRNAAMTLSPNPVEDLLTVRLTDLPEHGLLRLFNTQGVLLQTIDIQEGSWNGDVRQLPAGIYFVSLFELGKWKGTERFVKK